MPKRCSRPPDGAGYIAVGEPRAFLRESINVRRGHALRVAANGDKHLHDTRSGKPELFHLPDDVSESRDLLAQQPERARELRARWDSWNANNVPCRLMGYIDYHRKRDQFFEEAIPDAAKEGGYKPEINGNFK